ncbi:MAG: TIGR00730 family Rossman fold protein [Paludibacteraceae bacterium]|nr:TIGR00730 family Rossman fold protein [Paludibacteraceae bacterium]
MLNTIAVFCSASDDLEEKYYREAFEIGEELAKNNCSVVYGGVHKGLMKSLAEGVKSQNGRLIGIVPEYIDKKIVCPYLNELIIVKNLSERKQKMLDLSDKFLSLYGGVGTLDEFFSILAAKQIGEHTKDILLYDSEKFYNYIFSQLNIIFDKKFSTGTPQVLLLKTVQDLHNLFLKSLIYK